LKKKSIVLFLIIAVLSLGLVGCGNSDSKDDTNKGGQSDAANSNKIIVGYWGGTCEAPIFTAYELGYFKQAGLDVELLKITSDVTRSWPITN
jgi:NitT/TauT family transport system substrate-binding protein